jgi:hypothetical protein
MFGSRDDSAAPTDTAGASQVFLGGLASPGAPRRSELPPRFAALSGAVGDLFDDYRAGEMDAAEFAEAIASRRITDSRGVEWTIGATSGGWFRRDSSGTWVAAMPPTTDVDEVDDPLERLLATVDLSADAQDVQSAPVTDPEEPPGSPGALGAVPAETAPDEVPEQLVDAWGVPAGNEFSEDAPNAWAGVTIDPSDVAEPTAPSGPEATPAPTAAAAVPVAELSPELPAALPEPVGEAALLPPLPTVAAQTPPVPIASDMAVTSELDELAEAQRRFAQEHPSASVAEVLEFAQRWAHDRATATAQAMPPLDDPWAALPPPTPTPPPIPPSPWDEAFAAGAPDPDAPLPGVAVRGSGDAVWGATSEFDPMAPAPDGRDLDGIDGDSQFLNGVTDPDDPLAGL